MNDIKKGANEQRHKRCEGCKYANIVHATGGFKFLGCSHKPYKGKWIIEIESCPLEVDNE